MKRKHFFGQEELFVCPASPMTVGSKLGVVNLRPLKSRKLIDSTLTPSTCNEGKKKKKLRAAVG